LVGDWFFETFDYADAAEFSAAGWGVNGGSIGDANNWTVDGAGNATITSANGYILLSRSALETGKHYRITSVFNSLSGAAQIKNGGAIISGSSAITSSGTKTFDFFAIGTDLSILAFSGTTLSLASVSLTCLDTDRSGNANHATVTGTVTRTPVATGAELVAYSDFSSSSVMRSYAHSIGDGDFSILLWYNSPNSSTQVLFCFVDAGLTTAEPAVYVDDDVLHEGFNGVSTGLSVPQDTWCLLEISRQDGVLYASVNGNRGYSAAFATDFSSTHPDILIGSNRVFGNVADGALALVRLSSSALTADQIQAIYEAELPLFQENAAATLYGTSDDVTDIAFDKITDKLHVGTSDGRSVFSGLQRIDNTTTGITVVDANNDLISES
jgi:hypothetical protein